MMHGREKSDLAIVAANPANNDGQPSAGLVERRAGAEGNAGQDRTRRAQDRANVSKGLDRVRHVCCQTPKVGAECPNWARSDLCGGRSVMGVPTAIRFSGSRVRSPVCNPHSQFLLANHSLAQLVRTLDAVLRLSIRIREKPHDVPFPCPDETWKPLFREGHQLASCKPMNVHAAGPLLLRFRTNAAAHLSSRARGGLGAPSSALGVRSSMLVRTSASDPRPSRILCRLSGTQ